MLRLILATRNTHKTREFVELLGDEFTIRDLSELRLPQVNETGKSFEENAVLKAVGVSQQLVGTSRCDVRMAQRAVPTFVIADDSGLEVDSLGGAPGIFSARYAGANATDQTNVAQLLSALSVCSDRSARFRCVIALAQDGKLLGTFTGVLEGTISDASRGSGGFGYDPLFRPTGFDQTFAEMPLNLKNQISHRAKAAAALREFLRTVKAGR